MRFFLLLDAPSRGFGDPTTSTTSAVPDAEQLFALELGEPVKAPPPAPRPRPAYAPPPPPARSRTAAARPAVRLDGRGYA